MSMTLQATQTATQQTSTAIQPLSPMATLIPQVTASLQQLAPAIAETQVNMQNLLAKVTAALEASEKRNRELEASLAAEKAAREADKVAFTAKFDGLERLIDANRKDREQLEKDIAALKDQTKYIRPALKKLAATGGPFLELDYPGKADDVAQRKPILTAEVAALQEVIKTASSRAVAAYHARQSLIELSAEERRIAAFEAREGKTQEPPCP